MLILAKHAHALVEFDWLMDILSMHQPGYSMFACFARLSVQEVSLKVNCNITSLFTINLASS